MLTERPDGLRHAGQVSFPGGKEDPGDDFPIGTALREASGGGRPGCSMPGGVRVVGRLDDRGRAGVRLHAHARRWRSPTGRRPWWRHPERSHRSCCRQWTCSCRMRRHDRGAGARWLPHPLRRISVRGTSHLGCHGSCPRPAGCHPGASTSVSQRSARSSATGPASAPRPWSRRCGCTWPRSLMPLWQTLARDASDPELPPPYWAFAWAGGQALARYVLDHPEEVRGARVLDLATGSGLCAIAALLAGADRWCWVRTSTRGRHMRWCSMPPSTRFMSPSIGDDLLDEEPPDVDVILAGDIGYDWNLATRGAAWLRSAAERGSAGAHRRPGTTPPATDGPGRGRDLRGAHDAGPGADAQQAHHGLPGGVPSLEPRYQGSPSDLVTIRSGPAAVPRAIHWRMLPTDGPR